MAYRVELQIHDRARGREAEVLWRSPLPGTFATAAAAAASGRAALGPMGAPTEVVSFRIVDDAGDIVDADGDVIGEVAA